MAVPTRFCSTEDVLLKASNDFATIAPDASRLAAGDDGAIEPADPWLLESASADFAAAGVAPGDAVVLAEGVRPGSDVLLVAAVEASGVRLRRLARPAGQGVPPRLATPGGAVAFFAVSLDAQIAEATRLLRTRFKIEDDRELLSADDFRRAAVLQVLVDLYGDAHRGTGDPPADNLQAKYRQYREELDALLAVLGRTYGIERGGGSAARPKVGLLAEPTYREDPRWNPPDRLY